MLRRFSALVTAVLITFVSGGETTWSETTWSVPANTRGAVAAVRSQSQGVALELPGARELAAQEAAGTPDLETGLPEGMILRTLAVGSVEASLLQELGWITGGPLIMQLDRYPLTPASVLLGQGRRSNEYYIDYDGPGELAGPRLLVVEKGEVVIDGVSMAEGQHVIAPRSSDVRNASSACASVLVLRVGQPLFGGQGVESEAGPPSWDCGEPQRLSGSNVPNLFGFPSAWDGSRVELFVAEARWETRFSGSLEFSGPVGVAVESGMLNLSSTRRDGTTGSIELRDGSWVEIPAGASHELRGGDETATGLVVGVLEGLPIVSPTRPPG